jgi:hypothetical protein
MPARPSASGSDGGIDLTTLLVTAVASAAAAYTCSKVWAPGTLASAAFTPVLVAIIKEALFKPAKVVTQAVPVRGVVRSTPPPSDATVVAPPAPEPEPESLDRVAQQGEISYHSAGPSARARRWRLAIVTGLLGFVVAALAFTVPELVAGDAASGTGSTTFFGGQKQSAAPPTDTTTVPGRTVTAPAPTTVTVPAPAPQPVPETPAVTVPPVETTPAPATTTPAPAVTPPPPPVQP